MNEFNNPTACSRVEERIAFLYGELPDREARAFEQHRKNCSVCASELTGFGSIKQSIGAWRDQSLTLTSLNAQDVVVAAQSQRRAAWAAVSSFFELSPLWMKAATGFAVVLLCLLLGLGISRMLPRSQGRSPVVSDPASTQAFNEAVNKEVNKRLGELASERKPAKSEDIAIQKRKLPQRDSAAQKELRIAGTKPLNQRKPLSRAERDQLAADLRLIANADEDTLQLLGDRINRDE